MDKFSRELDFVISRSETNNYKNNYDYRRFGPLPPVSTKARIKSLFTSVLITLGLKKSWTDENSILEKTENFDFLYNSLSDDESRDIFLKVMAYRLMGYRKVKLPLNTPEYWAKLEDLDRQAEVSEKFDLGFLGWKISKLDLSAVGYPLQLYIRPLAVFTQLLLQQYRCQSETRVIEVEPGDTVIDGGGCYGDTAIYFALKAGQNGRVFSFEFMPDNLKIFKMNLALNPLLANHVQIVENPLWSSSGQKLFIEGSGPASHVTPHPQDLSVKQIETMSIDDLVRKENLDKVDFIKMDIEGAELEALQGAQVTIERFRPKLAISIYHKLSDFWEIPQRIDGLGLGYRFYLRHFTIHAEETVLFAVADLSQADDKK